MAAPLPDPEEMGSASVVPEGPKTPPSGPRGAAAFAEALLHVDDPHALIHVDDPERCSACGRPLELDHLTIEESNGITRFCRSCVDEALES